MQLVMLNRYNKRKTMKLNYIDGAGSNYKCIGMEKRLSK